MIDGRLSLKLRGGGPFGLTGRTCAGVRVDDVMTLVSVRRPEALSWTPTFLFGGKTPGVFK